MLDLRCPIASSLPPPCPFTPSILQLCMAELRDRQRRLHIPVDVGVRDCERGGTDVDRVKERLKG